MHHLVHGRKRVHGWKRVHGTIEKEQAELTTCSACITWGRANVRRKRVHGTIEKEQAELTTGSACIIWGGAEVRASRSSWLEKSSRYNRIRASKARHTQCMHYIGRSRSACI